MSIIRRRQFITLLGGAAVTWPLAARAQQAKELLTIGVLAGSTRSTQSEWIAAFLQRLRELGWIEGRTVEIEFRWAEGRSERYAAIAAEFVGLKVDVIVASGGAVAAAKKATSTIPIVFPLASDPVGSGLAASLARPGGNVTGLSLQAPDLAGKRVELLRELVPGLSRVAIMANVGYRAAGSEMAEVEAIARRLGFDVVTLPIRQAEDIEPAIVSLKGRTDALYVCTDPLVGANQVRIITLALSSRLLSIYNFRDWVKEGGLISYGPNVPDLYRRAAELVDKILRGAKPADLPIEQPTKFDLVINLKTAKALGLTIPPTLLARADEVIE
jgi:putative ABC transport system substrate-binding protein